MLELENLIEEYLLTLEQPDPNRHYDSEEYSESELAQGELESFFWWLNHKKEVRIKCEQKVPK